MPASVRWACLPSPRSNFPVILAADHMIVTPESAHELRRKRDLVALHLAAVELLGKCKLLFHG
jgi:hypothetical protein